MKIRTCTLFQVKVLALESPVYCMDGYMCKCVVHYVCRSVLMLTMTVRTSAGNVGAGNHRKESDMLVVICVSALFTM